MVTREEVEKAEAAWEASWYAEADADYDDYAVATAATTAAYDKYLSLKEEYKNGN
jgi:hypothetical protein